MGAGKILVLIGAILTLVSTFFLSFFATGITLPPDFEYASGLGFIFNLPEIISNGPKFAVFEALVGSAMVVYILAIVYIVFLLSGVLQLVGLASRVFAIIGSILPIIAGLFIIFIGLGVLDYGQYTSLFWDGPIVSGILPLDVPLGDASLGTYTLLAGGVLGFVGGILGTRD